MNKQNKEWLARLEADIQRSAEIDSSHDMGLIRKAEEVEHERRRKFISADAKPSRQIIQETRDDTRIVRIYTAISNDEFYGATPMEFARAIEGARNVELHISSPGGEITAERAIQAQVREHMRRGYRVDCYLDGTCASAATTIASICTTCVASVETRYMIHEAGTLAYFQRSDLPYFDRVLKELDDDSIRVYVQKTGLPEDEVREYVEAETTFTAEEAVRLGFIDRIVGAERQGDDDDDDDKDKEVRNDTSKRDYERKAGESATPDGSRDASSEADTADEKAAGLDSEKINNINDRFARVELASRFANFDK